MKSTTRNVYVRGQIEYLSSSCNEHGFLDLKLIGEPRDRKYPVVGDLGVGAGVKGWPR